MSDDLYNAPASGEGTLQAPIDASTPLTIELPVATALADSPSAVAPPDWSDLFDEDDGDDEWQVRVPGKRLGMRVPTAILVALLIAAGAFWGGAAVQRGHGSGTSGLAATLARLRGAAGTTGAGGLASAFGRRAAATTGTVTEVQGSTVYLTNTAGDIVTVILGPGVKITRTAVATASDLALGDTVVVQGTTAKNGNVTATSVTATAAGAAGAAGGRGGGGFGGGGFGAGG